MAACPPSPLPLSLRAFSSSSNRLRISALSSSAYPPPKKVLVPVGLGTEEMEAVVVVDILRRAGADVVVASVEQGLLIEASRRVKLVADVHISTCDGKHFDLIALPGGMPGSARLSENAVLKKMTVDQVNQEKLVGAICAAPAVALQDWGLLQERKATCHPGFVDRMSSSFTTNARVQEDGPIITSRGPGTSFDFALTFVEKLYGENMQKNIMKPLALGSRNAEGSRAEFNYQDWKIIGVPHVLVPIANGSEGMEAVIITDVLRRSGMRVTLASVERHLQVEASRSVKIIADRFIEDVESSSFDMIILPGGMPGSERLRDCAPLHKMLQKQIDGKRSIGAISSAPVIILDAHGWLKGKKTTCHPSFVKNLSIKNVAKSRVVIDGSIITSRGPGTTVEFALCIAEKFFGKDRASSVARAMVYDYS